MDKTSKNFMYRGHRVAIKSGGHDLAAVIRLAGRLSPAALLELRRAAELLGRGVHLRLPHADQSLERGEPLRGEIRD